MAENTDKTINKLKELKNAYKEALSEAAGGSEVAAKRAGELKDQINDLNESVKNFAAGSKFEQLGNIFGSLGGKLKNLDFEGAAEDAARFAQVTKSLTLKEATKGISDLGSAFLSLGKAIITNPIFLIGAAIVAIGAAIFALKDKVKIIGDAFDAFGRGLETVKDLLTDIADAFGFIDKEALETGETLKKFSDDVSASLTKTVGKYDALIAISKAAGLDTIEIERRKQEAIIKTNSLIIQGYVDALKSGKIKELTDEQKKAITEGLEANKKAQLELDVLRAGEIKKEAEAKKQSNEERKKANEQRLKDEKDAWDKLNKELQEKYRIYIQNVKDAEAELAAIRTKELKDRETKEQAALDKQTNSEISALNKKKELIAQEAALNKVTLKEKRQNLDDNLAKDLKANAGNIEALTEIYRKYNDDTKKLEFDALNEKVQNFSKAVNLIGGIASQATATLNAFAEVQQLKEQNALKEYTHGLDTRITALNDARDQELAKEGLTAQERENIKLKYDQAEYALELEKFARETEVKKKAFEQNKKLQIANTIITTIQGAVTAFANAFQLGPIAGPIVGAIQAALVTAGGVAQIAKIKNTKFDAGSPPSPPKTTGASSAATGVNGAPNEPRTPSLRKIGGNNRTSNGEGSEEGGRQPVKVYVVSSEVEAARDKDKVIQRRSSF